MKNFRLFIISGDGTCTEVSRNDEEVVAINKNKNASDPREVSLHFQLARLEPYLAGENLKLFSRFSGIKHI